MIGYTICVYVYLTHTGTTLLLPLSLHSLCCALFFSAFHLSVFFVSNFLFFCSILVLSYHYPYFFQLSLPLSLPHQNPAHTHASPIPYTCHMAHPSHSSSFDQSDNTHTRQHIDACVARTWISYRYVPCHPWCTHRTSLVVTKKNQFSCGCEQFH
jgi:hypothetical protein